MTDLTLRVDSQDYSGWKSLRVYKSLENISGSFDLELTDRWFLDQASISLKPGQSCELLLQEEALLKGWVESLEWELGRESHVLRIGGRDKTGDLVDCSIVNGTGEWRNLKLEDLIQALVEPFGIQVRATFDTGAPIKRFNAEQGMTVLEAAQKLCQLKACLALADGEGNLVLTRSGQNINSTVLVEGQSLLSVVASYDFQERFSEYLVKGQSSSDDGLEATVLTSSKGKAVDDRIGRHRPFLLLSDGETSLVDAKEKARWEAALRRGRSQSFRVSLPGWTDQEDKVWQLNELVKLKSPSLRVEQELLISGLSFRLDSSGTFTDLELKPKEAYEPFKGDSNTAMEIF